MDHDFDHGVAAAAHDLRGELVANAKFAARSQQNAGAAVRSGDFVRAERDGAAARFIGDAESYLDLSAAVGERVATGLDATARAVGEQKATLRYEALRAFGTVTPH